MSTACAYHPLERLACLKEQATIKDAAHAMAVYHQSAVLVLNDSGRLSGIVTERDMAKRVIANGLKFSEPVKRVMTASPAIIPESCAGYEAFWKMQAGNFRHLPAVSAEGSVVGMFDTFSLATALSQNRRVRKALCRAKRNLYALADDGERDTGHKVLEATTVNAAVETMVSKNLTALLVQTKKGKLRGIFTERDVTARVVAKGKNPMTTTVAEVMTPNPTCLQRKSGQSALQLMLAGRFRHLPVLDGCRIVGVLNVTRLLQVAATAAAAANIASVKAAPPSPAMRSPSGGPPSRSRSASINSHSSATETGSIASEATAPGATQAASEEAKEGRGEAFPEWVPEDLRPKVERVLQYLEEGRQLCLGATEFEKATAKFRNALMRLKQLKQSSEATKPLAEAMDVLTVRALSCRSTALMLSGLPDDVFDGIRDMEEALRLCERLPMEQAEAHGAVPRAVPAVARLGIMQRLLEGFVQIGRFHDIPAMLRQYNELYGKVLSGVASPMTVVKQLNRDVAGEVCGLVEDAEALFSAASHHQAITLITRALQGLDALSAVETVPLVVEEATVVEEADPEDDADPPTLPSRQQLLQLRATCYKKVGDLASAAKDEAEARPPSGSHSSDVVPPSEETKAPSEAPKEEAAVAFASITSMINKLSSKSQATDGTMHPQATEEQKSDEEERNMAFTGISALVGRLKKPVSTTTPSANEALENCAPAPSASEGVEHFKALQSLVAKLSSKTTATTPSAPGLNL